MSKFKNIGSWNSATKTAKPEEATVAQNGQSPHGGKKLVEENLERIRRGRKQYRTTTEEEHILQLMASIREHGFTGSLPVIAIEDANYDYEYLGGHTTGEALKRLGYTKALLSVEEVENPLALAEFSYQLNGANRPLNALDDTFAILDILAEALTLQVGKVEPDEIPTLIRQIARDTAKVDTAKVDCIKDTWERNQFAISIKSFAASRLPLLQLPEDLKSAIQQGVSPASALELNKIEDAATRADLIEQAMEMSVADIKQAVREVAKAETQTRSAQKKEWEPLKIFRAVSTKAKKINFDSIPATKKKELTKAIQRVQELVEEIESAS
ncbi:ParB/RepB/Spo0J family partition protein [Halomicronema sp. CCY15110]|uniref:ParB/RepB/Spo0J family partition protein n=1 Tax=Halomicronema sp. CCY15110 TaxID=2767773 RepID=UPI00194DD874|nr:ParB/RepB/Spo0J family partition protein [Halomicronema sp. CCY15110]